MYWHNWQEFLRMGGYAFYVWGSFAVTFTTMALEVLMLHLRKKALKKQFLNESLV